ncbi:MAG TPA: tail fiber domain-containing protein [Tahibacter sp.]|uniref:tail fiber domain-containing protein n=1 Tax=Tahibacter sp. TaxID=2056211 RepID=UPI002C70F64F|nr:tail fiber domain-containing protein [Tahibacter sp.]HSX60209.1 tail fiber domain-containing protein [Tahibacter sp.]
MANLVSKRRAVAAALTVALGLLAGPAFAAGDSVRLAPAMQAPAYQLRVTGPAGFLFERTFAAGQNVAVDAPASGWVDGDYRYELIAVAATTQRRNDGDAERAAAPQHSESGSFTARGGVVQVADGVFAARQDNGQNASPVPNDQVIPDDLIVQGSGCFGFDCVNNESFGFDTIRLKENNLRIKFEDTSVGAFPTTDWQLTANDSASGGANRFSIEDVTAATIPFTVTGGAPSNAIFVDSTGRVGFRTSTPVLDLHVTDSDTPALRLEQTGAGGFTPQTWDVAGNEANFFIRDVTGGSKLSLRIRPGAPTSSLDINSAGLVGFGTASPTARLHAVGSDGTTTQLLVQENNATAAGRDLLRLENKGPTRLRLKNTNTSNEWSLNAHDADFRMTPAGSATVAMTIFPTGNVTIAGTLTQNSDRNSKENFRTLDHKSLLQKIAALDITEWNFKYEKDDVRHIGPMAQDFHKVFGLGERDDRIAPLDTSGVALAAVQGLQKELAERDRRIADLESRLERLDALTQQIAAKQNAEAQAIPASFAAGRCEEKTVATGL